MQAAGKSEGRWSIWSSIKDTRGLITIDNPFCITEHSKYVRLFPDAVYETNNVDFPYRIFLIVSYWPCLNDWKPNKSLINFYKFDL